MRQNKFKSRPQVYNGEKYHSGLEASYAAVLDLRKSAKKKSERVVGVRRQARVSLDVNGMHICDYYCDFEVTFGDGRVEWHEVKGFQTDTWRLKEKLFRALYPGNPLIVVRAADIRAFKGAGSTGRKSRR